MTGIDEPTDADGVLDGPAPDGPRVDDLLAGDAAPEAFDVDVQVAEPPPIDPTWDDLQHAPTVARIDREDLPPLAAGWPATRTRLQAWASRTWHQPPSIWVQRGVSLIVVLGASAFVLSTLHVDLLFRNTTPTGGDMGAHVWGPMYMLRHLLPHGEVSGWTPDWYAGFPAFGYYMVGPAMAIVALHVGAAVWASIPLALAALAVAVSGWVVPRLFVLRKVLAVVGLVPGRDHRSRAVQHRFQAGDGVGPGVAPDLRLGVREARRSPLPGAAGVRAGRAGVHLQPGAADPVPQRRRRDRHRQHHRRQHALDDGGRVLVLDRALARAPLPGGAAARHADGTPPRTGRRPAGPRRPLPPAAVLLRAARHHGAVPGPAIVGALQVAGRGGTRGRGARRVLDAALLLVSHVHDRHGLRAAPAVGVDLHRLPLPVPDHLDVPARRSGCGGGVRVPQPSRAVAAGLRGGDRAGVPVHPPDPALERPDPALLLPVGDVPGGLRRHRGDLRHLDPRLDPARPGQRWTATGLTAVAGIAAFAFVGFPLHNLPGQHTDSAGKSHWLWWSTTDSNPASSWALWNYTGYEGRTDADRRFEEPLRRLPRHRLDHGQAGRRSRSTAAVGPCGRRTTPAKASTARRWP